MREIGRQWVGCLLRARRPAALFCGGARVRPPHAFAPAEIHLELGDLDLHHLQGRHLGCSCDRLTLRIAYGP
jgi:hypothetical protein